MYTPSFTLFRRGDLIKDFKGRSGVITKGNTKEWRVVDVYVFGVGEKTMHDTRIELISSKG